MARRLEYVGNGRMRDAETRNLISAKKVVEEFNAMAERLNLLETEKKGVDSDARGERN